MLRPVLRIESTTAEGREPQEVAEEFVVEDFVKPAVLDIIGGSQYGAIPKSSTSMALISMMHAWVGL